MKFDYASAGRSAVVALLLSTSFFLATPLSAQTPEPVAEQPQRLILRFAGPRTSEQARAATAELMQVTGTEMHYRHRLASGQFDLLSLQQRVPPAALDRLVAALQRQPGVLSVEVDRMMQHTAVPNDSRYSEQWHYFEGTGGINLEAAWDTHDGSGVVVAVIDTGITGHSDLNANILPGYDFIDDTAVANDGDGRDSDPSDPGDWLQVWECGFFNPSQPRDSSWHGTHVAGTIAAITNNGLGVAGVAPGAKVLVARVLGKCGGYTSDIIDAIVWSSGGSVSGVPDNPNPAHVINLSLGGGGSCGGAMQSAIDTARDNGTTVVVAAGNSNGNAADFSPANCNGVVTVAANDRQGNRASYSNYGDTVEVTAPGGETNTTANGILSTLNSGTQGPAQETYRHYQGTSMATPHVAGVAALLYQASPGISPDEVSSILQNTARPLPGSCSGGCGAGIVDARAALDTVATGNPPPQAEFSCTTDELTIDCMDQSGDPDGNITAWDWDFGDGNTSSAQNPSHSYAAAGTYNVSLTVTDNDGVTDSTAQEVTVSSDEPVENEPPVADFSVSVSRVTASFTDNSSDSDGSIASWAWDFGDGGSATTRNPSHAYSENGTYQVTLTATDDDGASHSVAKSVTINCRFWWGSQCLF